MKHYLLTWCGMTDLRCPRTRRHRGPADRTRTRRQATLTYDLTWAIFRY